RKRAPGSGPADRRGRQKGADAMSKRDGVFVFIGTYASEVDARADYEIVKELHAAGAVGTYDAAVVSKDSLGKVHVNKDETTTRHGAWGGAAAGSLIGLWFPMSAPAAAPPHAPWRVVVSSLFTWTLP